ncbi:sll0787 family AIR synthase-like protein [Pseudooceanicola nanhaiensis]|uniref:sll0787 family AIR synthase-like protein n=1 Tax=Pseudooceanicola nanhaiensis TaxID=375761 RepID=UPI001CD5B574|nr:sll0787 family AIR synthase-like protein [Pseudooceanicola nanhaiensis]MCA0921432.1 sll0787 family AIR synthase-like protein [Pseudooceanicola nanhaiensis]
MSTPLTEMTARLQSHPSIRSKLGIAQATRILGLTAHSDGRPGDDAAALPRAGGYDLLAGEGFIPAFIGDDPWFAGWCAVMVNLSDIAAMGGRASAIIDQVWAPDADAARPLLQGLRDASAAYDVPLVGGHTNLAAPALGLAASVLGQAQRLITSFDARPGDVLIAAIDHRGSYRNFDNFCAALDAPHDRLCRDLALLPALAEDGLVRAGKDISQGGIVGTALMLAECSRVGIEIDLDRLTLPPGVEMERWLRSFPSFGFLLSVAPDDAHAVCARFAARGIEAGAIGRITGGSAITMNRDGETAPFWDHALTPYLDLGADHA